MSMVFSDFEQQMISALQAGQYEQDEWLMERGIENAASVQDAALAHQMLRLYAEMAGDASSVTLFERLAAVFQRSGILPDVEIAAARALMPANRWL